MSVSMDCVYKGATLHLGGMFLEFPPHRADVTPFPPHNADVKPKMFSWDLLKYMENAGRDNVQQTVFYRQKWMS